MEFEIRIYSLIVQRCKGHDYVTAGADVIAIFL